MSLQARQTLLARYLDDPAIEQRVRNDPEGAAQQHGVPLPYVRWLATLEPQRVQAFRNSRLHKEAIRQGRQPKLID